MNPRPADDNLIHLPFLNELTENPRGVNPLKGNHMNDSESAE